MLHRWGYGEFSAHFLVGGKCLSLYTYQRFRQFDRGYLLMLVGGAQFSGESGVRASRCGYGGVIGDELSQGDRSHATVRRNAPSEPVTAVAVEAETIAPGRPTPVLAASCTVPVTVVV